MRLYQFFSAIALILAGSFLSSGCNDEPESPGISALIEAGGVCDQNAQCSSGLCVEAVCTQNAEPTAQFANDPVVTLVGIAADIEVVAADADNDPLDIVWKLELAPAGAEPALVTNGANASLTPDKVGIYRLNVTVSDALSAASASLLVIALNAEGNLQQDDGSECSEDAECASGRCEVGACAPNNAPVADAGKARTVDVGAAVELDGSGSSDADGDALSYQWQFIQLPTDSAASLSSGTEVAASFTPDVEGLYVVALWVNDGFISSQPDTVAVVAMAEGSTTLPDGDPCASDDACSSGFCLNGTCTTNQPPVAASCGIAEAQVGMAVTLDGAAATDPEGQPLSYSWTIDQAPNGSTAAVVAPSAVQTTFTPDVAGTYLVRLVVNDGFIDSLPGVCAFVAYEALPNDAACSADGDCASGFCDPVSDTCQTNTAPTVGSCEPVNALVGVEVSLNQSATDPNPTQTLTYTWTLDQAPQGSTAALTQADTLNALFVPDVTGSYLVRFVANDGLADSAPGFCTVTAYTTYPTDAPCVDDADCESGLCDPVTDTCQPNTPPTAAIAGANAVMLGETVTLSAVASDAETPTPLLAYSWTIAQAPFGSAAALSSTTGSTTSITPDTSGPWVFGLVVNDGLQDSTEAFFVVTVAAVNGPKGNGEPCGSSTECASGFCYGGACAINQAPVAVIDAPTSGVVGTPVTLLGDGSSDFEGAALTYAWTLLDAPAQSTAALTSSDTVQAALTPDYPGPYVVGLAVDDGLLTSSTTVAVIDVVATPGSKPNGDPCTADVECASAYCSPTSGLCACRAKSCAELGAVCGSPDNGCGETILCGTCTGAAACNPTTFQCDCTPLTCGDIAAECGAPDNGCGTPLDCGACGGPTNGNGTGSCDTNDFTCGYACNSGFHACGTECVPDASPESCGTLCTPCPGPPSGNGISGCDVSDYSCNVVCDAGFEACNGDCIDPMTDAQHCGGCGVATCPYQCVDGACVTPLTLEYISGDGQSALPNSPLPAAVRVRVTDPLAVPQSGITILVAASEGAAASATTITNAQGIADVTIWTGRDAGDHTYTLTTAPASNEVTVTATATTPVDGTLIPVVNVAQTGGSTQEGPASQSSIGASSQRGYLAAASDGTVYFADNYRIWRVSPAGALTHIGGSGSSQTTGDFGPALDAGIGRVFDLALDEQNNLLYLYTSTNRLIRYIDLSTGDIEPFAGGGSVGAPGYGNGGPAVTANLPSVQRMTVQPGTGDLYMTDNRSVRYVNRQTQIIDEHPLSPTYGSGCGGDLAFWNDGGAVAFSQDGTLFVGGQFCGGDSPGAFNGVVRLDADGTRTRVAGSYEGSVATGIPAREHKFSAIRGIFFDVGDNLYVLESLPAVRRIDAGTTRVTAVIGTGVAGGAGDYGPAVDALINNPQDMAYASAVNRIIVDDHGNSAIREAWAGADTTNTAMTLRKRDELQASGGGDGQTGVTATSLYGPLGVYVTDAGQNELSGLQVRWEAQEPGTTPQVALTTTTPPSNNAIINGRVALKPVSYTWTASLRDLHGNHVTDSPQTFTVGASEPAPGTLLTLLNPNLIGGSLVEGPSLATQAPFCRSAVEGPAGSIFAACGDMVLHISADLDVSVVAGSTSSGDAGDGGPAFGARFDGLRQLVYDAARDLLYLADRSNNRVRMIDFNMDPPSIFAVAGGCESPDYCGGTAAAPGYGDGLVATAATLTSPKTLALSADGNTLYIGEVYRIRRVDLITSLISTVVSYDSGDQCTNKPYLLWSCGSLGCGLAVDPATDDMYFSGNLCGTALNGYQFGIFRFDPATEALSQVAGDSATGADADGYAPLGTKFSNYASGLAVDAQGNIYLSEYATHRIRYVDFGGVVSTVAGTGTAGNNGNLGPAVDAQLNTPAYIALFGGSHLLIGDTNNEAVRVLW